MAPQHCCLFPAEVDARWKLSSFQVSLVESAAVAQSIQQGAAQHRDQPGHLGNHKAEPGVFRETGGEPVEKVDVHLYR